MTMTREQAISELEILRTVLGSGRAKAALDLAIAALGGGWRPIEEAPRDGRILGWNRWDGVLVYDPYQYGSNRQFDGWRAPYDNDDVAVFPSHFHPLPPSPQGETK